jgi:hypothetical protein
MNLMAEERQGSLQTEWGRGEEWNSTAFKKIFSNTFLKNSYANSKMGTITILETFEDNCSLVTPLKS